MSDPVYLLDEHGNPALDVTGQPVPAPVAAEPKPATKTKAAAVKDDE